MSLLWFICNQYWVSLCWCLVLSSCRLHLYVRDVLAAKPCSWEGVCQDHPFTRISTWSVSEYYHRDQHQNLTSFIFLKHTFSPNCVFWPSRICSTESANWAFLLFGSTLKVHWFCWVTLHVFVIDEKRLFIDSVPLFGCTYIDKVDWRWLFGLWCGKTETTQVL